MSAKPAAAPAAAETPPPKGKSKLLVIVLASVVLLGGAGGGAWFFLNKKGAGQEEAAAHAEPRHVTPTYMALDNMVVNLADAGGERFAQVGITLDLESDKTAEQIKTVLPKVRSNVLMLVSQRSSEELLKRDGKEKLAADIVAEVSRSIGYEVDEPTRSKKADKADAEEDDEAPVRKKKKKSAPSPVHGVLFSAFIVQ